MSTTDLTKLHTFDYQGVRLLESAFKRQLCHTRDYYLAIPNDDILKGFREQAGLPAPGEHLGGWCSRDSHIVFGQWLSGMARLSKATDDAALRDKALALMRGWAEAKPVLGPNQHYIFDKYVGGLLDMYVYLGIDEALPLLSQITDWAIEHLSRRRLPASDDDSQGGYFTGDMEWYTLAEHLYRAYQVTGDEKYREFGDVWLYPHYWEMFTGERSAAPYGYHGYSHVNTLCSAAMAYAISGEDRYLETIVNAYDYFQQTQCYATGGYGPGEKLMRPNGELGESLVNEPNMRFLSNLVGRSFETPCGTWAVFKLVSYLLQFTGEARYGDWMERLLYNGIGASPLMGKKGRTFYYADYRLLGGSKVYHRDAWPCCSGTYIQDVAEYANIIYYHDAQGLAVNLYVPSEVTWTQDGQQVTLYQWTGYPEEEQVSLTVELAQPAAFALRCRIPAWAQGATVSINEMPAGVACEPGTWASIERTWQSGDRLTLRIPLKMRLAPIDAQHPRRVAVVRGPSVLVRTAEVAQVARLADLDSWLQPGDQPGTWTMNTGATCGTLVPFQIVGHGVPYQMYFDLAEK